MHGTPPLDHQASPAWIYPRTPEASLLNPERWRNPQPHETCVWHYSSTKKKHSSAQWNLTKLQSNGFRFLKFFCADIFLKITFHSIHPGTPKYFLHTYLIAHFIGHVYVGFARKWGQHIIYIVPGLGPHISWVRVRRKTYLDKNSD